MIVYGGLKLLIGGSFFDSCVLWEFFFGRLGLDLVRRCRFIGCVF